jgi:hypothetical protein
MNAASQAIQNWSLHAPSLIRSKRDPLHSELNDLIDPATNSVHSEIEIRLRPNLSCQHSHY